MIEKTEKTEKTDLDKSKEKETKDIGIYDDNSDKVKVLSIEIKALEEKIKEGSGSVTDRVLLTEKQKKRDELQIEIKRYLSAISPVRKKDTLGDDTEETNPVEEEVDQVDKAKELSKEKQHVLEVIEDQSDEIDLIQNFITENLISKMDLSEEEKAELQRISTDFQGALNTFSQNLKKLVK